MNTLQSSTVRLAFTLGLFGLGLVFCVNSLAGENAKVDGWLTWRGPHQNGFSDEKGLPEKWSPAGENLLWSRELSGQSTSVIANGKLYILGFVGDGTDLQEGLFCMDAETGKPLWDAKFNDFLSDTIYNRYASSSPCIDAETNNVYMQGSQGMLACFTADGKPLWHHSMMEEYGWMTFPNARTTSPVVDGPLVITADLTANWGAQGPPAYRLYAFDKLTGEAVWSSQPGEKPRDSCFSTPLLGWYKNQRVLFCGGGDGSLNCVNTRTGDPVCRFQVCRGGVNSSAVFYKTWVIAIHGSENVDDSTIGSMTALNFGDSFPPPAVPGATPVLPPSNVVWRNNLCSFTSSPTLAGNRIYQTDETARLCCVDAETGKIMWKKELGAHQLTSCPLYADGKLYVPIQDGNFYIIKPSDTGCEILSKEKPDDGSFEGSPSAWNHRVYFQSTKKLYCIGLPQTAPEPHVVQNEEVKTPGALAKFLVVPNEMLLHPGQVQPFRLVGVDANGAWLPDSYASSKAKFEKYIPPTAKVKAMLNGDFTPENAFKADPKAVPSAGAIRAEIDKAAGVARARILPDLPIHEDFESFQLQPKDGEPGVQFAFPPLPWIGARLKWEIRERDGSKCMVKTIDNKILQRAYTFIGHPDMANYTVQADVMSDGVSRNVGGKEKLLKVSEVGLINQRYAIILKGSSQQMEVNSNIERLQVAVPFAFKPKVWYTLKTRVDVDVATGSGVVRGKAWTKGEAEPDKWTIEAPVKNIHKNGSPGVFGFSPTDMPVYVDNLSVVPN